MAESRVGASSGVVLSPSTLRQLRGLVDAVAATVIAERRDFHRHAETGWTEFRTASLIARRLVDLGFTVRAGREVVDSEARMGVPEKATLDTTWERARAQGGDQEFLEAVRGGFTGVVATLSHGEGPTVGLRFDIDALDLQETQTSGHRPAAEGFASINDGAAHACGHDAHAAIGLGVARILSEMRDAMQGTVKLVFQPAEEGVRGAKAMVAAGVVDDVDAMLALHVYSGWSTGAVDPGKSGFLATDKFDAILTGEPAHAGGSPHLGRNALLAAATAVLNLHAIPRHRGGTTRINVGRLTAGQGRNVIAPTAHIVMETRGATSELNDYMRESAHRILAHAAAMYDCELEIRPMGSAKSADSDPGLAARITQVLESSPGLSLRTAETGGGSEDYTYMMRRVQELGGVAANIGFGADIGGWGHHTAQFDIDESALPLAVEFLVKVTLDLQANPIGSAR
ncbi:MAG: amidohydrolase [Anaerolineae bacterium]|nr:amidohydrolase [Anaerolineae bacterium]